MRLRANAIYQRKMLCLNIGSEFNDKREIDPTMNEYFFI